MESAQATLSATPGEAALKFMNSETDRYNEARANWLEAVKFAEQPTYEIEEG